MFIPNFKRIALGAAVAALAISGVTACDSGDSATEDFKKDLVAVGLKVDGNVAIDREKKTLGMAPVSFVAGNPKPKPEKSKKAATKPSSTSPSTKNTKAPKVTETLEALVKLSGSTNCRVELERPKKATSGEKKVKGRVVEYYAIGELVTPDGDEVEVNSQPGVYDMNAIVGHIKANRDWRTLCFA